MSNVMKKIEELPVEKGAIVEKDEVAPTVAMMYGKEATPFNDMIIVKGTSTIKTVAFLENADKVPAEFKFEVHKLNSFAEEKGLKVGDFVYLNQPASITLRDENNHKSIRYYSEYFKKQMSMKGSDIGSIIRETPNVEVTDYFLISVHNIICYFR